MRVLVACERSGRVRDAFRALGHTAWSCDLEDTDSPGLHFKGDVTLLLDGWTPVRWTSECSPYGDDSCSLSGEQISECACYWPTQEGIEYTEFGGELFARPEASPRWDLMIAHPPCTYLSSSGLHWNGRIPGRNQKTEDALSFVRSLLAAPIDRIALENPIGRIGTAIRPADQVIQPWQFGEDASKATALWLKNLPPLRPTSIVPPRIVAGKRRWANQTDSGQNRLGPSPERATIRSATYLGIAEAMADQWGRHLTPIQESML